ncbi:12013_t:CDS:2 [Diversispora eburnea]|uniref:12013_t:CDS:1 n=1 Tax=Diversispora eburnea TaxID=1213867 RepID=A0A9N8YRF3_9GLOM|nr:12013_t:CDS:2 [Diversispora eburnea]
MKIHVKILTGNSTEIEIKPSEKILKIKQSIERLKGIPTNSQRIYFFGEILDDNNTIADYDIQNGSSIHLKYLLRENMQINVEINYEAESVNTKFVKIGVKPTDKIWSYSHSGI